MRLSRNQSPRPNRIDEVALASELNDPANWIFGVFYRAPNDPRWLVPMRFTSAAWTPNLAHPRAVVLGFALIALAVGPLFATITLGRQNDPLVMPVAVIWLLLILVPTGVLVRRNDVD